MMATETPTETSPAEARPAAVQKMKPRPEAIRMRTVLVLAARVQVQADGTRVFVRFTPAEIVEHWLLMITFLALGLTGLLQRYAALAPVSWSINSLFGGIESLRTIHHLAAIIFILVAIVHAGRIVYMWFVKHQVGAMIPDLQDGRNLVTVLLYNLGRTKQRPRYDRFSVEEKVEYWALIWGTVIMALTGLMQWFPTITTRFLPGEAIPIARLAHSMEAILALLSIAIWHMYHTIVKEKNRSIFNGLMSEHDMKENHPLEYERIIAAYEYVQSLRGRPPKQAAAAPANPMTTNPATDEPGTAGQQQ
jgi:formate dehydrogenase gamma subunit